MLIALDYSLIEIQRRLGHRKPDTTLRVYAHEWKYREAQRSTVGAQLQRLFSVDTPDPMREQGSAAPSANRCTRSSCSAGRRRSPPRSRRRTSRRIGRNRDGSRARSGIRARA